MTQPSSRDLEQISAYLDGQLSGADAARLEARIKADPELLSVYAALRQTRSLLRQLPARRAPRNFRLTPQMVGIRVARPRIFPFFRLASVLATILLFLGYAVNLSASGVGGVGTAAMAVPAAATQESQPFDTYAAPSADEATEASAEPTAEIAPKMMPLNPTQTVEVTQQAGLVPPTPSPEAVTGIEPTATLDESMGMQANSAAATMPQATEDFARTMQYQPEPPVWPIQPLWLLGLLGLAVVSGASAFVVDKRASRAKPTTREIVLILFALVVVALLAAGIYWMSLPR